jgi:hypothetical protein
MKTKHTPAFAVRACNGAGFLAIQGNSYWFEPKPVGWALFSTKEGATDALESHHSELGTKPNEGGVVVTVLGEIAVNPDAAYLDWVNNYISTDCFAESYGLSKNDALALIDQGRIEHEKSCRKDESCPLQG